MGSAYLRLRSCQQLAAAVSEQTASPSANPRAPKNAGASHYDVPGALAWLPLRRATAVAREKSPFWFRRPERPPLQPRTRLLAAATPAPQLPGFRRARLA